MALAALVAGCAAPGPARSGPAPITAGIWYSVETAINTCPGPLADTLDRDFAVVHGLGLDTVFVKHASAGDAGLVKAAAARAGLRAVLPDTQAQRHVRCGSAGDSAAPVLMAPQVGENGPVYIGHVVDEVTARRAEELADAAAGLVPPRPLCVSVAGDMDLSPIAGRFQQVLSVPPTDPARPDALPAACVGGNVLATVECLQHRKDEQATVRQWLAGYHAGLSRGCTGGFVLDEYRTLPGHWRGVVGGDGAPTPERAALIKRLAWRARRWGALLRGLPPRTMILRSDSPANLRAVAFGDERHHCLLLVNTSATAFVRGTAHLPAEVSGQAVSRAVAVSTEDAPAGQVFSARQGELSIEVQLAPADAELFELFHVTTDGPSAR